MLDTVELVVVHPLPEFNSSLVVVYPCRHLFQKLLHPQSPLQSLPQVIEEQWCRLSILYDDNTRLKKIIILL